MRSQSIWPSPDPSSRNATAATIETAAARKNGAAKLPGSIDEPARHKDAEYTGQSPEGVIEPIDHAAMSKQLGGRPAMPFAAESLAQLISTRPAVTDVAVGNSSRKIAAAPRPVAVIPLRTKVAERPVRSRWSAT
jgi:hypothetical protein